ncbi:hypothetical protein MCOR27_001077 [Pyricularia oryzae]|nr:hypothetical protein OOU_Y34scaffold00546g7 [Pyricularia oryzae Y34]KAH9433623.1 hypothetical protein MCOR02_005670 [Pyricularia oryzae]KAI6288053.1 hypothetical protein MCOR27_001077 [Pyricularia oryzae]KAI6495294.1 hypothetical protein MCOR13_007248 [Pyricularia oryzae]KAI6560171.1 hypothetical protein MCOR03_004462 [Pyricularia oryzae]
MDDTGIVIDPQLPKTDIIVLNNIIGDIREARASKASSGSETSSGVATPDESDEASSSGRSSASAGTRRGRRTPPESERLISDNGGQNELPAAASGDWDARHRAALESLEAMSDPKHADFEPTVFVSTDLRDLQLPKAVNHWLLQPYIRWAQGIVRTKTDVVMWTHLLIYFTTTIPSAAYLLLVHFSWTHGVLHFLMQLFYMPTYTLMMHQHIHQRGVLAKSWAWLDRSFPFVLDPLMGHTWNSYYYHHVKHHHVEGNGPGDLSSTIYFQRDNAWHFAQYVGRFYFLVWLDLPLYFMRKKKYELAARAAWSECFSYFAMYCLWRFLDSRAAFMVVILPFLLLRLAFMAGNWGQHAFVDWEDADSDYRSSITLIDVPSNRYCFNDGYHTSHHLNPLRHWRQHPVSFIKEKETYAREKALVFHGLDFNMITIKCLQKDYMYLAQRLVPLGDQVHMTMEERADMLRQHTRQFTKEDIARKFRTTS